MVSKESKVDINERRCPVCSSALVKDTGLGVVYEHLTVKWNYRCKECGSDFSILTEHSKKDESPQD